MSLIQQLSQKIQQIEGVDTPIVKWGGIASIAIILWAFMFSPYIEWREQQQQQIQQKIKKVSRLQALQAAAEDWQQAEQNYQQAKQEMLSSLFQQASYVTAQTELLELLRILIKQNKITLKSQRLKESEAAPGIGQKIAITLSLYGARADFLRLLHQLGQHKKLLNISKLYINKDRTKKLAVTLEISGFRLSSGN